MNRYNNLLTEIRACFPGASSISISICTTDKDISKFSEELNEFISNDNSLYIINTIDPTHDDSNRRYFKYEVPGLGSINLIKNGS